MMKNIYGTVSERTSVLYQKSWDLYTDYCKDNDLDVTWARSVIAWRTSLIASDYSPNTINSHLSAIKSILRASVATGEISVMEYTMIRAVASVSVRALRDRLRPKNDKLTDSTVMQIIDAIDTGTLKGLRDKAMICVLATTGVRIEELTELRLTKWFVVDKLIYVKGKTDIEERAVPVSEIATTAMLDWVYARNSFTDYVFTSFAGRSERVQDKAITTQGAYNVVVERAQAVGVNISPHDFRRYVATKLAETNIVDAQAVLGHKSIMTTQRYVLSPALPSVDWLSKP